MRKQKRPRLSLPSRPTPFIPDIGVIGVPISKTELVRIRADTTAFIASHGERIRGVLEAIGALDTMDIDNATLSAYTQHKSSEVRARSAWEVVAWHTMFQPYSHVSREFYYDTRPLIEIMSRDPSCYYLYATLLLKQPSEEVYNKLRAMHSDLANTYLDYAKRYTVAAYDGAPVAELYTW